MSLKEEILQGKRRQAQEHAQEIKWNDFYYRLRKFTARRVKKGKDWMLTEQEVDDESIRYPEVEQLYFDRLRRLGISFSDARYNRYMKGIKKECDALQAKLDAEAEFWGNWEDVPNINYNCHCLEPKKHTPVDDDVDNDDDEYYVDITQD